MSIGFFTQVITRCRLLVADYSLAISCWIGESVKAVAFGLPVMSTAVGYRPLR